MLEDRLSSGLGRRDEAPNIALAEEIAGSGDRQAVANLVAILTQGKRPARHDAIKVLYEIGERNPTLISDHAADFLGLTHSPDNRLVWGALTSLACICKTAPQAIAMNLDDVLQAADRGSVIAKDQAVVILITLATDPARTDTVMPVLLKRLQSSAVNQLPMYAEKIVPVLRAGDKPAFRNVLEQRLNDDMVPSKKKRLVAVLKRL